MPTSALAIFLTFIASLINSGGSFLLKKGSKVNWNLKDQMRNWKALLGLVLLIISGLIYLGALRYGELSVLFPVSALTYIWILVLGRLLLKEHITNLKIIGIILIVLGIVLVVR